MQGYLSKLTFLLFLLLWSLVQVQAQEIQETDSLMHLINKTNNPQNKIEMLLQLSNNLQNNNPDQAITFAKKAKRLSTKEKNKTGEVQSIIALAKIYWRISDYKKAMNLANQAKLLAEKADLQKELALSLRITGLIFIELNNYDKSTEYFFKSLEIFETINDSEGVTKLLSDIGSVNFHQYNYEKALEYYFRSLFLAKENQNKNGIARALNNIAAVYEAMKDFEKADTYFQDASQINKEIGNTLWEGINYMNLGTIKLNLKDYDASYAYLEKALDIFSFLKSKMLIARCQLNMAKYYTTLQEFDDGLKYATMALEAGRTNNWKQVVYDASSIVQGIYVIRGDKEKAYDFVVLQYQMKDSLILMGNKEELTRLELQYEFDKKEQAKEIKQHKKDSYVLILIISLLVTLLIIILILSKQRVKAKNALLMQQKLEFELDLKNKELTANVMSLMKKNEILSAISDKLIIIEKQAVKEDTKKTIKKIAVELQKTTEKEILNEFELRFKQVHSDFYNKLLEQFPNLSPNEQRLCAFLRLNMSSKEISDLTGQRISSLETARYRLRKKLGITNSNTNLITFLSNL